MTPKFVSFRAADGSKIYVNLYHVMQFEATSSGGTRLATSFGTYITVCESMEAVAQKFAAA